MNFEISTSTAENCLAFFYKLVARFNTQCLTMRSDLTGALLAWAWVWILSTNITQLLIEKFCRLHGIDFLTSRRGSFRGWSCQLTFCVCFYFWFTRCVFEIKQFHIEMSQWLCSKATTLHRHSTIYVIQTSRAWASHESNLTYIAINLKKYCYY